MQIWLDPKTDVPETLRMKPRSKRIHKEQQSRPSYFPDIEQLHTVFGLHRFTPIVAESIEAQGLEVYEPGSFKFRNASVLFFESKIWLTLKP